MRGCCLLEKLMKRDGFAFTRRENAIYGMCFAHRCVKARMAGDLWHETLRIDRKLMGGTGRCSNCGTIVTALDYLMISPRDPISEHDALVLIRKRRTAQMQYVNRTKPIFRLVASPSPSEQLTSLPEPSPSP